MNLLFISPSYKPAFIYGGPIMSVAKLCEVLTRKFRGTKAQESSAASGSRLAVFTTTANGIKELPIKPNTPHNVEGVSVTYFKRLTKDHSHFSPSLLIALFLSLKKKNKNCIIHIQAWWNLISVLSCVVALLKKSTVILSPRGTLSNYSFNNRSSFLKKAFHHFMGLPLLKRCHFHVTTEKEKQDILKLLTPLSITVIPNFVELPEQVESSKIQTPKNIAEEIDILSQDLIKKQSLDTGKPLRLLFLSRIEEKKGLDLLLESLSKINIPWTLKIAGDGHPEYVNKLKRLVQELNLNSNLVTWLGHKSNEEKFDLLKEHDLLVLPSHDENFANVVIESLAMGIPVLISKHVGLADYVSSKKLGWICDTTPQSIADQLSEIYKMRGQLKLMGVNNIETIKYDYRDEYLVDQYVSLYKNISSNA